MEYFDKIKLTFKNNFIIYLFCVLNHRRERKEINKVYIKPLLKYPPNANLVFDIALRINSGTRYSALFRSVGRNTIKSDIPSAEIDLRESIQRSSG